MAETAVLGVGRNEIPPYYTELSKSTVQVLLTSARIKCYFLANKAAPLSFKRVLNSLNRGKHLYRAVYGFHSGAGGNQYLRVGSN